MSEPISEGRYKALGRQLKALRARVNESLAEASGAVEIDVRELASYELGNHRPSEDVLLLLISHFDAHDDEAVRLWEMAGYTTSKISAAHMSNEPAPAKIAGDNPVLFTDIVDVTVNNYGVVMNFMQNGGSAHAPNCVARVGMSREHARSVMEILQATLGQIERHQNLARRQPSADTPDTN